MEPDPDAVIVLMEVRGETDYVRHHIQKVACIFAAMRAFARDLRASGHTVRYITINDPENRQSIVKNLAWLTDELTPTEIWYQEPDEWRVDQELRAFADRSSVPVRHASTEHFLTHRESVQHHFAGKKTYVMESFYRKMRRTHNVLMDGANPVGGTWNYDAENRKKWKGAPPLPTPLCSFGDLTEIVAEIRRAGIETIGSIDPTVSYWPITRNDALDQLEWFVANALPHFGHYQDAMVDDHEVHAWSMFHSRTRSKNMSSTPASPLH